MQISNKDKFFNYVH